MADVLTVDANGIITTEVFTQNVVEVAMQGPPGPPGPPGPHGPAGDANGAFLVTARLAEIAADTTAQAQARANLGLAVFDGGTFF